jgi:hypothetical protein
MPIIRHLSESIPNQICRRLFETSKIFVRLENNLRKMMGEWIESSRTKFFGHRHYPFSHAFPSRDRHKLLDKHLDPTIPMILTSIGSNRRPVPRTDKSLIYPCFQGP